PSLARPATISRVEHDPVPEDLSDSASVESFPLEGFREYESIATPSAPVARRHAISTWFAIALGLIALAEAGVIAMLSLRQEPVAGASRAERANASPSSATSSENSGWGQSLTQAASLPPVAPQQEVATPSGGTTDANAAALLQAASHQRSGGVRLVTPIEV